MYILFLIYTPKDNFCLLLYIAIFYISLVLTLWLRYGDGFYSRLFDSHIGPFSIILAIWLIVFYIAGIYDFKNLKNDLEFDKKFWYSLIFNAGLSIAFFYLNTNVNVAPKTGVGVCDFIDGTVDIQAIEAAGHGSDKLAIHIKVDFIHDLCGIPEPSCNRQGAVGICVVVLAEGAEFLFPNILGGGRDDIE